MRSTLTSPSAIQARLEQASEEGWAARIRVSDGTELSGIVSLSDDGARVEVLTGQAVARLRSGAPAHASLTGPEGGLSFYSGVMGVHNDGRVELELPRVVRVVDTRDLDRKPLDQGCNVKLVVPLGDQDGRFEVVDLSPQGLSFRVPTTCYALARHQRLEVRLQVPGSRSLRLTVTVRNLRRDPRVSGSRLVGAQVDAGPSDLAQHVADAIRRGGRAA